jgi:small subunit ribosomal protein S13
MAKQEEEKKGKQEHGKGKQEQGKEGKEEHAHKRPEPEKTEMLVRIMSTDIPGSKNVFIGLTRIKGISFSMSNAICLLLKLDKKRKISTLTKEEIEQIRETIKNPNVPDYMKNRRNDFDNGETKHLTMTDLDLKKEFDIKRQKKTKSYKGVRHSRGLPVRGQRTKSHFRRAGKKKAVGVQKKK